MKSSKLFGKGQYLPMLEGATRAAAPQYPHVSPLLDGTDCRAVQGSAVCRWKCGNECAHPAPNPTQNEPFARVLGRFAGRRALLRGAAAAGVALVAAPHIRSGSRAADQPRTGSGSTLNFRPIGPGNEDRVIVPPGYTHRVLLCWGDRLFADAPPFDITVQSAEAQNLQFGYNNDFIGFLPLPFGSAGRDSGLLVVNHEYTNPELMFPEYNADAPTLAQVDVELAAHGLTVVELRRTGEWSYMVASPYNRRITGETEMLLTGPAAGHDWLRTTADPAGLVVRGTLNNCSAGKTPWGTVLTAEENFNQYFANLDALPDDDPRKAVHRRYGMPAGASERKWERFYSRFDIAREPNEAFRFGWMVEIDPYDPAFTPRKRTALGRMKHEAASFLVGPDGRVGVYMGDDERFDYVYKFVTAGRIDPRNRAASFSLLDDGTLYAARFNDDGTGDWLPLVFGQGPLAEAGGFSSQAGVLIKTRLAADAVGATKMDRPEDIEVSPVTGKIYMAMTNNTRRTAQQVDRANPRANNRDGHIIEVTEAGNDPAATRFTWEIFMLCGDPQDESTHFAGFPKDQVSPISSPDNLVFDASGNLWIFTDGQPGTLKLNDAVYVVPVDGPERGHLMPFLSAVPGAETASGDFDAAYEALFVSIQHPGEGGTMLEPLSRFPDGGMPVRPGVVVAWKTAHGDKVLGS